MEKFIKIFVDESGTGYDTSDGLRGYEAIGLLEWARDVFRFHTLKACETPTKKKVPKARKKTKGTLSKSRSDTSP